MVVFLALFKQCASAFDLCFNAGVIGRLQSAGGGACTTGARCRRASNFWFRTIFDDQRTRCDDRGDFGVAELFEEPEDVAVYRLLRELLSRMEVAAYKCGVEACIQSRSIKRNQAAFSISDNSKFMFSSS